MINILNAVAFPRLVWTARTAGKGTSIGTFFFEHSLSLIIHKLILILCSFNLYFVLHIIYTMYICDSYYIYLVLCYSTVIF